MRRTVRFSVILAGVVTVLLAAGSFAAAAAPRRHGNPCTKYSLSAINQYCEAIPSAGGPQTPTVGTPSVGASAPRSLQRALLAKPGTGAARTVPRSVRLKLSQLPAASRSHPLPHPVARASVASLSWTLILILIGIALALCAIAFERWRR